MADLKVASKPARKWRISLLLTDTPHELEDYLDRIGVLNQINKGIRDVDAGVEITEIEIKSA